MEQKVLGIHSVGFQATSVLLDTSVLIYYLTNDKDLKKLEACGLTVIILEDFVG